MELSDTLDWSNDEVAESLHANHLASIQNVKTIPSGFASAKYLTMLISKRPSSLQYLKTYPSESVLSAAAQNNPRVLKYIKSPSNDMLCEVLEVRPDAIEWVVQPTLEQQCIALKTGQDNDGINTHILAAYVNKFSSEALDKLKPGLSFIVHMLEGAPKDVCEETINRFLAKQSSTPYSTPSFGFKL